jgi:hypothetical protein
VVRSVSGSWSRLYTERLVGVRVVRRLSDRVGDRVMVPFGDVAEKPLLLLNYSSLHNSRKEA